jgi:hypothetical protein
MQYKLVSDPSNSLTQVRVAPIVLPFLVAISVMLRRGTGAVPAGRKGPDGAPWCQSRQNAPWSNCSGACLGPIRMWGWDTEKRLRSPICAGSYFPFVFSFYAPTGGVGAVVDAGVRDVCVVGTRHVIGPATRVRRGSCGFRPLPGRIQHTFCPYFPVARCSSWPKLVAKQAMRYSGSRVITFRSSPV